MTRDVPAARAGRMGEPHPGGDAGGAARGERPQQSRDRDAPVHVARDRQDASLARLRQARRRESHAADRASERRRVANIASRCRAVCDILEAVRRAEHLSIAGLWVALALASLALALASAPAASAMEAGGLAEGPWITSAGLLWVGASGPMLGQARVAPGGAVGAPLTAFNSPWVVLDSHAGVEAGRLGSGRWRRLKALSRCRPLAPASGGERAAEPSQGLGLAALAGGRIFAVVDPRCVHRGGYGRAAILSESLASGSWRLLGRAPKDVLALGASDDRVAIAALAGADTDSAAGAGSRAGGGAGESEAPAVTVESARSGRRLYRVVDGSAEAARRVSLGVSVDDRGDVLVSETQELPPPATRVASGWWASPARPRAHGLGRLLTSGGGASSEFAQGGAPVSGAAALAAGRIAYATSEELAEKIVLLDIRTGSAVTVAVFPGETRVLGLDLSATRIAWAQLNQLPEGNTGRQPGGAVESSCVVVAIGEPQLAGVDLAGIPASGLIIGPPLPAADTPPCTDFES